MERLPSYIFEVLFYMIKEGFNYDHDLLGRPKRNFRPHSFPVWNKNRAPAVKDWRRRY
jgi:hypothetical protein